MAKEREFEPGNATLPLPDMAGNTVKVKKLKFNNAIVYYPALVCDFLHSVCGRMLIQVINLASLSRCVNTLYSIAWLYKNNWNWLVNEPKAILLNYMVCFSEWRLVSMGYVGSLLCESLHRSQRSTKTDKDMHQPST